MLPSIGDQLKSARQNRNASIDDVSRAVHIKPYFIEALEENRFSDIPSQAQMKGFLRLYAGWLEIPASPLLDLLDGKTPAIEVPETNKVTATPQTPPVIEPLSKKDTKKKKTSRKEENLAIEIPQTENQDVTADEEPATETDSRLLFDQIGVQLKTCREKLDVSVDEIEKLTHIRARYLLDMESGNFNDIPSMVQARGLLSGYSNFLNLDTDALLSVFADALQKRRLELLPRVSEPSSSKRQPQKGAVPKIAKTGIRHFFTLDFILGSLILTGVVVFAIFAAIQVISNPSTTSVSKPPPISDVLRENPGNVGTPTVTPTEGTSGMVKNPESFGLVPTSQPADNAVASDSTATPNVPLIGNDSMQVYIVPNQRVFLQVITGKKTAFLGRTVPGTAYPFTSNERIEVICGNAAGIQIYYNQRDLGTLGLQGQSLRMIFSKEGIITPTSMAKIAPTVTPLPTLTLRPTATKALPTVTPLIP